MEGVEVLVSPVKLFIVFWLFYKNRGCSVRNKMGRKWFRIFLIRWRWLLTYFKILLSAAIGWATIVFDLLPRIGICCLVFSLIDILVWIFSFLQKKETFTFSFSVD